MKNTKYYKKFKKTLFVAGLSAATLFMGQNLSALNWDNTSAECKANDFCSNTFNESDTTLSNAIKDAKANGIDEATVKNLFNSFMNKLDSKTVNIKSSDPDFIKVLFSQPANPLILEFKTKLTELIRTKNPNYKREFIKVTPADKKTFEGLAQFATIKYSKNFISTSMLPSNIFKDKTSTKNVDSHWVTDYFAMVMNDMKIGDKTFSNSNNFLKIVENIIRTQYNYSEGDFKDSLEFVFSKLDGEFKTLATEALQSKDISKLESYINKTREIIFNVDSNGKQVSPLGLNGSLIEYNPTQPRQIDNADISNILTNFKNYTETLMKYISEKAGNKNPAYVKAVKNLVEMDKQTSTSIPLIKSLSQPENTFVFASFKKFIMRFLSAENPRLNNEYMLHPFKQVHSKKTPTIKLSSGSSLKSLSSVKLPETKLDQSAPLTSNLSGHSMALSASNGIGLSTPKLSTPSLSNKKLDLKLAKGKGLDLSKKLGTKLALAPKNNGKVKLTSGKTSFNEDMKKDSLFFIPILEIATVLIIALVIIGTILRKSQKSVSDLLHR